jgi:multimeric flavodoxin WrbA
MNLTIINGIPDDNYEKYELALEKVKDELSKKHNVDLFTVRNMNISYCCGCFSCWVKTPGLCVFDDDMNLILKSMASTDYIIYFSPLTAGFVTSYTKKVMDRFIPNALPYIKIYDGECHHPQRYNNKQRLGLVILEDGNLDNEAIELTSKIFERFSINMHAPKFFKAIVNADSMGVILDEIGNC